MLIGTYSSIFIASPIVLDFDRSPNVKGEKEKSPAKAIA
jgi:preprotein translocase subunit SecF